MNDHDISKFMQSFITGNYQDVIPELLPFMNSAKSRRVRWIPRHMTHFLTEFVKADTVTPWLRMVMDRICDLFRDFELCDKK